MFDKLKRKSKNLKRKIYKGRISRGRSPEINGLKLKGTLSARLIKKDGPIKDFGIISDRVVTTAGVNYLTDSFQDSTTYPMDVFKYHDSGIGVGGEVIGDTGLGTSCGESRDTGSQAENGANVYKTVATHTYAGTFAITEHGLFSAATTGTLWDRSVFSAINVISGDKIEFTYELTSTAGG